MMKVLYVNACPRSDSRTDRVAKALLSKLALPYEELVLRDERLFPVNEETLKRKTALLSGKKFGDPMFSYALQFAEADLIVMSAPFWDLSFPAILKTYIENIYAVGIVSEYNGQGMPVGLCKAKKLYYVTTAGGPYTPTFGYGYIESLCRNYFGIRETELIYAEGLDVIGNDPEEILRKVIAQL